MGGIPHHGTGLHPPDRSWLLAFAVGPIALLLLLSLWIGHTERRGASPGGSHTTWEEALRQAEAVFREGQMVQARDALAEAYRLSRRDPGWEGLVALGDLMQRLGWKRQTGYYGRLSFTARGAYLQAFHHANARRDWEGMFVSADRLEALGDRVIAARLQALAWRQAKRHPEAVRRLAALRMPDEDWP